jgi:maltose alpha-D-glucosyltransferase/alpha-amylase
MTAPVRRRQPDPAFDRDPEWYKDAVIYEVHVRAFCDSDGDGIGDFNGITSKLDYIQELGATTIWLLPFYPSPLRDDGYDIADYTGVHPSYGTLKDFKRFLGEAHRRGMRVITELVVNHTSDQHPWFQRARRAAPGSRWRNWYVWSDTPEKYAGTRVIFQDFEPSNWTWDPVAQQYYWHRFYSHQPDLNFDNPEVRRALEKVADFWLRMGVDALRLDAVPYLFEREGTNCENLPETHAYLRELRAYVDANFDDRMLIAEANQWPEDAIAYFGEGDECHMAFQFPLMPRLFMATRMEDRFPIIDIVEQTPPIPENCQWANFLRNHDELTLEMVTDEERDYMYRVYAHAPEMRINLGIRRRLAPLLQHHRDKIELLNGLLLSLPGTPVLYYGDEIGMGDNVYLGDRDSVRTPMQWNADRNAGFSTGNPQRLYLPVTIDPEYHYETVNVAAQLDNPESLLRWMRQLIALRRRHRVFGRGSIEFLAPDNHRVLAFLRRFGSEQVLVVANLSRSAQFVELDLSEFRGLRPLELFGHTQFPTIGDLPYLLTLGPYDFYWLSLEGTRAEVITHEPGALPALKTSGPWTAIAEAPRPRAAFEALLPDILRARRWFGGKTRRIESTRIVDVVPVPLPGPHGTALMTIVKVEYLDGEPDFYSLPLAFAPGERGERLAEDHPQAALARLTSEVGSGILHDAHWEPAYARALLKGAIRRRTFAGASGTVVPRAYPEGGVTAAEVQDLPVTVLSAEQSNTSMTFGDRYILKAYRRLEAGLNPDLEIGRFLNAHPTEAHVAVVAASFEYRRQREEPTTLGIVHRYVPNSTDVWAYTVAAASRYYEQALNLDDQSHDEMPPSQPAIELVDAEVPVAIDYVAGEYLTQAELLGCRTAQLHLALSDGSSNRNFEPEPVTVLTQRALYQTMRNGAGRSLRELRRSLRRLPDSTREEAERILPLAPEILERLRAVTRVDQGLRIRHHGDLHLGQVLTTGRDFVFIDFEGEPTRSLNERRIKRSPLRDVAGMLRSLHYSAYVGIDDLVDRGLAPIEPEPWTRFRPWAEAWSAWAGAAFLRGYLKAVEGTGLVPTDPTQLRACLDAHLLEKALYELAYELSHRPTWARIPMVGIRSLMGG